MTSWCRRRSANGRIPAVFPTDRRKLRWPSSPGGCSTPIPPAEERQTRQRTTSGRLPARSRSASVHLFARQNLHNIQKPFPRPRVLGMPRLRECVSHEPAHPHRQLRPHRRLHRHRRDHRDGLRRPSGRRPGCRWLQRARSRCSCWPQSVVCCGRVGASLVRRHRRRRRGQRCHRPRWVWRSPHRPRPLRRPTQNRNLRHRLRPWLSPRRRVRSGVRRRLRLERIRAQQLRR